MIFKLGKKSSCYVCKKSFWKFIPSSRKRSTFTSSLGVIGSDIKRFLCPYCGVIDRTRHLFLYFDKINLWDRFKDAKILHFAPEKELLVKINSLYPIEYVLADLYPRSPDIKKVDVTSINYPDEYFDIIICNHVLEHVTDYKMAISEIFRSLKFGGVAVLQTPYSNKIHKNFSDNLIQSKVDKALYYGDSDHLRVFGKELIENFSEAGFKLRLKSHKEILNEFNPIKYGVNANEDLIYLQK